MLIFTSFLVFMMIVGALFNGLSLLVPKEQALEKAREHDVDFFFDLGRKAQKRQAILQTVLVVIFFIILLA